MCIFFLAVNYTVVIDSEKKAGRRGFIQLANGDKVSQLTGVLANVKTVTCIRPKNIIYLHVSILGEIENFYKHLQ